jgi:hypothetical protein
MKRALVALPLAALALSIGADARADKTSFAALAEAKLDATRVEIGEVPKSIPATEQVAGFHFSDPPYYASKVKGQPTAPRYITVAADVAATKQSAPAGCMTMTNGGKEARGDKIDWQTSAQASISVFSTKIDPMYKASYERLAGIRLVKREALDLSDASHPKLSVKLAWIDPDTKGARLVEEHAIALTKIATAPGGVRIYGARSGNDVEVIVTAGDHDEIGSSITLVNADGGFGSSGCGHAKMRLHLEKKGEAAMVSALEEVVIGEIKTHVAEGEDDEDAREIRVRPLRVDASLTWLSRDAQPVFSLNLGWAEKERIQPM